LVEEDEKAKAKASKYSHIYSHISGSGNCESDNDMVCNSLEKIYKGGTTLHDKMISFSHCKLLKTYTPLSNHTSMIKANPYVYNVCKTLFFEYNSMAIQQYGQNRAAESDLQFVNDFTIFINQIVNQ
ncbi:MAG: hypothetical protein GQ474_03775, partial [Sulfurimonas sp.]|nr:hypothetical protein [Sulfurimonas sp.]